MEGLGASGWEEAAVPSPGEPVRGRGEAEAKRSCLAGDGGRTRPKGAVRGRGEPRPRGAALLETEAVRSRGGAEAEGVKNSPRPEGSSQELESEAVRGRGGAEAEGSREQSESRGELARAEIWSRALREEARDVHGRDPCTQPLDPRTWGVSWLGRRIGLRSSALVLRCGRERERERERGKVVELGSDLRWPRGSSEAFASLLKSWSLQEEASERADPPKLESGTLKLAKIEDVDRDHSGEFGRRLLRPRSWARCRGS